MILFTGIWMILLVVSLLIYVLTSSPHYEDKRLYHLNDISKFIILVSALIGAIHVLYTITCRFTILERIY